MRFGNTHPGIDNKLRFEHENHFDDNLRGYETKALHWMCIVFVRKYIYDIKNIITKYVGYGIINCLCNNPDKFLQ